MEATSWKTRGLTPIPPGESPDIEEMGRAPRPSGLMTDGGGSCGEGFPSRTVVCVSGCFRFLRLLDLTTRLSCIRVITSKVSTVLSDQRVASRERGGRVQGVLLRPRYASRPSSVSHFPSRGPPESLDQPLLGQRRIARRLLRPPPARRPSPSPRSVSGAGQYRPQSIMHQQGAPR